MDVLLSELEMAGLPLKHVRPESKSILGRVERLVAEGKCLCDGEFCDEPAHPGCSGLSRACKHRFRMYMLENIAPTQRDSWHRKQIRLGKILWPRQGQGKRKPRLGKAAEAAAAAIAATVKRASKRAAKRAAIAKLSKKVEA